jgi:predicted nucleotidyltransferase
MLRSASTRSWPRWTPGLWPEATLARLATALDDLVQQLRREPAVACVVLFGSYARGDYGRSSDVDLLILIGEHGDPTLSLVGRDISQAISRLEVTHRLPMHLAPLMASAAHPAQQLGADLLHALWRDGIVLYAQAGALGRLLPSDGLSAWSLVRFHVASASAAERVQLSRRLHGRHPGQPGLVRPPSLVLGPGVLLLAAEQTAAVTHALDAVGAMYDLLPVWREA